MIKYLVLILWKQTDIPITLMEYFTNKTLSKQIKRTISLPKWIIRPVAEIPTTISIEGVKYFAKKI